MRTTISQANRPVLWGCLPVEQMWRMQAGRFKSEKMTLLFADVRIFQRRIYGQESLRRNRVHRFPPTWGLGAFMIPAASIVAASALRKQTKCRACVLGPVPVS